MDAPEKLGDFKILREIGRGGMGVVYEAEQISLSRRVAVKILPPSFARDRESVQRFFTEAKAAARLQHRNVVPVYAVGEENGLNYYAMKLVRGRTLGDIIDDLSKTKDPLKTTQSKGPALSPSAEPGSAPDSSASGRREGESYINWVCRLVAEAADGLDFAHRNGVLHRDVKPTNILIDENGVAMILDFGVARVESAEKLTMTGDFVGTPAYTSREQLLGDPQKIGPHSDVYSLGVTLYELVTLAMPYPGESPMDVIRQVLAKEPVPPRKVNPRVPKDLETILLTALDPDVQRRYKTAAAFASDVRRFLAFQPIQARPTTLRIRAAKFARRNPLAFGASIVAGAAVMALGIFFVARAVNVRAQIRSELDWAESSAAAGEFDAAEGAVNRALGLDPSNETARLLLVRYQAARAKAESARAEALDRAAIDAAVLRAEAALLESESLRDSAAARLEAGKTASEFEQIIVSELARALDASARRTAAAAGGLFVQALTLRTATGYRHDEIESRAAETFFDLFQRADTAGDRALADAAGEQAVHFNRGRDPRIDHVVGGNGTLTVRCDVPGATAHLFEYVDVIDEDLPYSYRRVPVPQPPDGTGGILGGFSKPDWETLNVGSLDIPTAEEIERALTHSEPPLIARDESVFDRCRLESANLASMPIRMGTFLLVVQAPSCDQLRLPFVVGRNEAVSLVAEPIPTGQVPAGFVHIPDGISTLGGGYETSYTFRITVEHVGAFLIAKREVTEREYAAFVNAMATEDWDSAISLVPVSSGGEPAWVTPPKGSLWVPTNPDLPVVRILPADADAYCDWLTRTTNFRHRLPTEEEWERAARGADGRYFPWGAHFLPKFTRMAKSRPDSEAEQLEPGGRFVADRSVFGVEDMAGNVSEFTSLYRTGARFARGGNYRNKDFKTCTTTIRFSRTPTDRHQAVGFRVARDL